jgi:CubicO group peptidase (beta-lactamase class C family)
MDLTVDTQQFEQVQQFLRAEMREEGIPGLAVGIVTRNKLRFLDGLGARNIETNRPVSPSTLFGIGSCTKSMIAYAIHRLVTEGELALDDPLEHHLPVELDTKEPITLHHLLSHSSGIPSLGEASVLLTRETGVGEAPILPFADVADMYDHVNGAEEEIVAAPGERFMYFNTGFDLLGQVIESVSGKPVADYLRTTLFDPLGMDRATFNASDVKADDDALTPYAKINGEVTETGYPTHELGHASGGLYCSIEEFGRYLQAVMKDMQHDGNQLLPRERVAEMHQGYTHRDSGIEYGHGWMLEPWDGEQLIGHGGSILVSTAYMGYLEDTGVGVVLSANIAASYPLSILGKSVLSILQGDDPRADSVYFTRERRLDQLTGEYASYQGVQKATVTRETGGLLLDFENRDDSLVLLPESPTIDDRSFTTVNPNTGQSKTVEFDVDNEEVHLQIDRWYLHQR